MFRAVLKLTYFPGAWGLVLPEYSELQASLQINDEPVMILPPASGPAGY
jgi:hypothetical protein